MPAYYRARLRVSFGHQPFSLRHDWKGVGPFKSVTSLRSGLPLEALGYDPAGPGDLRRSAPLVATSYDPARLPSEFGIRDSELSPAPTSGANARCLTGTICHSVDKSQ